MSPAAGMACMVSALAPDDGADGALRARERGIEVDSAC